MTGISIDSNIANQGSVGRWLVIASGFLLLLLLVSGCTTAPAYCPPQFHERLSAAAAFAADDRLPFQFPLDPQAGSVGPVSANFCVSGITASLGLKLNTIFGLALPLRREYHAAEDYLRPAGTPVYAIADGELSFSGPMGGYGWLIIIDHPQANLYSLYGHLSPSRWYKEPGPVAKGELIGYLGDDDENGGSAENPLRPHLHLGLRAGQRADYPANGEWRWMAGWITPCPADIGWLKPSAIIIGQEIPAGGFLAPTGGFWSRWGGEIVFSAIFLVGATGFFIFARRKDQPLALVAAGLFLLLAGFYFYRDGWRMSVLLFGLAILFISLGIYRLLRRRKTEAYSAQAGGDKPIPPPETLPDST